MLRGVLGMVAYEGYNDGVYVSKRTTKGAQ